MCEKEEDSKRTIQWFLERDEEHREYQPTVRLTLRDGMQRSMPMSHITHVTDASLWVAELSLPPTVFSIKYSLRMSPWGGQQQQSPPGASQDVERTLLLDGNWLVIKFPGEDPVHFPFRDGRHTLFMNHLPSASPATEVSMAGHTEQMGSWNPEWRPFLVKVRNGLWLCPLPLEPSIPIEFKLKVRKSLHPDLLGSSDGDNDCTWEAFYNPFLYRSFTPRTRCNMVVFSSWGELNDAKITEIPHNKLYVYANQSAPSLVKHTVDASSLLEFIMAAAAEETTQEDVEMMGDTQVTKTKPDLPDDFTKYSEQLEAIYQDFNKANAARKVTDAELNMAAAGVVEDVLNLAIESIHLDMEIARQAMNAKLSIVARGIVKGALKSAVQIVDQGITKAMDEKLAVMAQVIVTGAVDAAIGIMDDSEQSDKDAQLSHLAQRFVTEAVGSVHEVIDEEMLRKKTMSKDGMTALSEIIDIDKPSTYELAEDFFNLHLANNNILAANDEEDGDKVLDELAGRFVAQITLAAQEKVAQDAARFGITTPLPENTPTTDNTHDQPTHHIEFAEQLVDDVFCSASAEIYDEDEDARSSQMSTRSAENIIEVMRARGMTMAPSKHTSTSESSLESGGETQTTMSDIWDEGSPETRLSTFFHEQAEDEPAAKPPAMPSWEQLADRENMRLESEDTKLEATEPNNELHQEDVSVKPKVQLQMTEILAEKDVVRPKELRLSSHSSMIKESLSADASKLTVTRKCLPAPEKFVEQQHSDCTVNRPPHKPLKTMHLKQGAKQKKKIVAGKWTADAVSRSRSPTRKCRLPK